MITLSKETLQTNKKVKLGDHEVELKDYLLDNKSLLGDNLGDATVIFEKQLSYSKKQHVPKTIADALVLTENAGIIGVEIKSKNDSTRRLKRQLRGYSLNCNKIFVLCHDSHAKKVEEIIESSPLFTHVGILSFTNFRDKLITGLYREATDNPYFSAYHALNMCYREELVRILRQGEKPGMQYYYISGSVPKGGVINNILAKYGDRQAIKYMCEMFINGDYSELRTLTTKDFRGE